MKSFGKRVLAILCAIVIMLSLIMVPGIGLKAEATENLKLESMQIVLPARSTELERKAASELQAYIKKMTGKTVSLVGESQISGAGIYIGNTNYAHNNGVTYPTEGDTNGEAWAIKEVNGNLVLCGAPERGVLYAVYHLLEDVLGVRMWNQWEEYVPAGSAVVPAGYADSGVPAMKYREVYPGFENSADNKFSVFNRLNGNVTNIPAAYGGEENYGYIHVHTFNRYFTYSDYSDHPDWFAQIGGARDSGGQLCLTNAALKTEFANRLKNQVVRDPDAIYSVSPADKEGKFCQCSTCQSQINTYGLSGYILKFVNEMAAAVADAGYTEAKIEMLVYWEYIDAPKGGVTPADNVQIRFADPYTDLLHSINHTNNAGSKAKLQAWANICSNDVVYWQYVIHNNINGVFPTMFHYGEDITTLQAMGVNGWFAEQEQCINTDFWDMKQWLLAKLMEEPVSGAEYIALMDEFIYGYYGNAAGKHIRDYLYYMNAKAEATNASKTFGLGGSQIIQAEWLSVQDIIAGNEYFEKAFAAAGNDATLLRRLRAARAGLDRVIVENYAKWKSQAASAGLTLPFTWLEVGQRVYFTIAEQAAFRGNYDAEYDGLLENRYNVFSDDQPALPSGLSMDPGHYVESTAEDMLAAGAGFCVVEDTDSLTGMAILGDSAKDSSLILSDSYISNKRQIVLYYYNGSTNESTAIGSILYSNVKVDQGYQLYSFSWTVPSTINDSDYLYMFNSWGFQNRQLLSQIRVFAGQRVTLYLNMKVVGKVYGSGAQPVYYIDRMIVVPYSQLTHNYVVSPTTYGVECRSICTICGDAKLTEHNWDSGVVTKAATVEEAGEKIFTCQSCAKTKTEVYYVQTLPEELQDVNPKHIKVFDTAYFTADDYGTIVDDPESPLGKAYNASMPLGTWFEVYRYSDGESILLSENHCDNVKYNAGYVFYKRTVEMPATMKAGGITYVRYNNTWVCQSAQMAQELEAYAGKTIDFYFSAKVNGTAEDCEIFVDQMIVVDQCEGENCPICGGAEEEPPQNSIVGLPEELKNVNAKHIKQFDASYFTADDYGTIVDDPESPLGKAYNASMPLGTWFEVYRYSDGESILLSENHCDNVQFNAGYVFYKRTVEIPATMKAGGFTYVRYNNEWVCQSAQMAQELEAYAGKTIDFYFSAKVNGTAEDCEIFVDQMIVVDQCKGENCPICGGEEEEPPQNSIVGLPEELKNVNAKHIKQFDASYFTADDYGTIVDDPESPLGKAYNASMPLGTWFEVYRYSDGESILLSENHYTNVQFNAGYVFYKRTVEIPATMKEGGFTYVRYNNEWVCQSAQMAQELEAYAGKTIDFYFSAKVNGTAEDCEIFVDQMIVVDQCEGENCPICGGAEEEPPQNSIVGIPEELKNVNAKHIKQFDVSYFAADDYGIIVDDPESPLGKAYNASMPLGTWFEVYRYSDGESILLSENHCDNVKYNAGYVFYKRTVEMPATMKEGGFTYVRYNNTWVCQSAQMAQELEAYAGKTIDFYFSAKVNGTAEDCEIFVDQMIVVDQCEGENCPICGGEEEEPPQEFPEGLPEELWYMDAKHIKQYDASVFAADDYGTIVDDSESPLGKAYNASMPLGTWFEVYHYSNGESILLSENHCDNVQFNAGYVFYKRTVQMPETIQAGGFTYVRYNNTWVCQSTQMAQELESYAGKTIDFYLSAKVNGTAEDCEIFIDQMIVVDFCDENWDSGLVTTAPTVDKEGVMTHTCTVCGAVREETIPKLPTPVTNWNLVLDGNIGMNFVLNVTADEAAAATVDVSINGGKPTTRNVAELLADGKYILTVELAAAQMADTVTVTLNKGGVKVSKDYSVRSYAEKILSGDYSEETKTLVKYMLVYGAASQKYFGHNDAEENLADKGIEVTPVAVPAEGGVYNVTGSAEGVAFYGASLVHRNKIAVRIYFSGDVTNKTFTVNGTEVNIETKGDLHYIEVANICPQDLGNGITVAVDGLTVTYSPLDYIIRMYAKSSDSAALVQALYGYHKAAVAYLA